MPPANNIQYGLFKAHFNTIIPPRIFSEDLSIFKRPVEEGAPSDRASSQPRANTVLFL